MMEDHTRISRESLEDRIDHELSSFRSKMLAKPSEELYELSYRIYMTERIGVTLKEMLPEMKEEELLCLEKPKSLLGTFYEAWSKFDDDSEEKLKDFLHRTIAGKSTG